MNRRSFILQTSTWPMVMATASSLHAGEQPWKARFVDGGFDGKHYWAGFGVEMFKGWKTYWRVPGAGGIPPQVDMTGENLAAAELLYPLPRRYFEQDGESIGYKDKVVFPVRLSPKIEGAPLEVKFSAFFGVCEVVCIPAKKEENLRFAMDSRSTADTQLVAAWRDKVPAPSDNGPVLSAEPVLSDGRPTLNVALARKVEDLFVQGSGDHYFQAPRMAGLNATLAVSGAKSADELKGQSLRFVSVVGGKGLEQLVQVF